MSIKAIYPDTSSWLSDALEDYFKSIKNEYFLSLFDALKEYTEYHSNYCAYFKTESNKNLKLYFQIEYDEYNTIATLRRVFFLSEKAYKIISYDALKDPEEKDKSFSFDMKLLKKESKKENKLMELNVMMTRNNIELPVAKEILLKKSYERHLLKKILVLRNENDKIEYEKINRAMITFDLSFLKFCGFLSVKRYESFEDLLPKYLIAEVPVILEFEIPKIPEKLKEKQLINTFI